MNSDRLKILQDYLKNDPNDPFTKYAIAMEYLKSSPEKAEELLADLVENHSEYLPTYYQLAQLYFEHQDYEQTKSLLNRAIKLAQEQVDRNTERELRNLLNEVLFDEENE